MNSVQKAEQAVKNAQNQLDEAMRQLGAAKDPWRHDEPEDGWFVFMRGDSFVRFIAGGRMYYLWKGGNNGRPIPSNPVSVAAQQGWRYAEDGEVKIPC